LLGLCGVFAGETNPSFANPGGARDATFPPHPTSHKKRLTLGPQLPQKKRNRSPDSLGASCSFECDASGEFRVNGLSQDEECNVCQFVPEFAKRAGPRAAIYHDPQTTHAAIVNCGGLCPGINDVIRSVVTTLETGYGVQKISGIRYGFGGFWKEGSANLELTRANTSGLQKSGGSVIGTGRGGGDVMKIVDSIEKQVRVAFPKSDTRCFADCPRSNYVVTTYITSARFYRSC
tara:strand:+ start:1700 stop:2398 length:699 start_codon:yes stop_codon:yes gene_type:complete